MTAHEMEHGCSEAQPQRGRGSRTPGDSAVRFRINVLRLGSATAALSDY